MVASLPMVSRQESKNELILSWQEGICPRLTISGVPSRLENRGLGTSRAVFTVAQTMLTVGCWVTSELSVAWCPNVEMT